MVGWLRETPRLMLAPIVVGVAALALYLLGTVPEHLQATTSVKEYSNLETAESALGFKIAVPSYFPSYLAWPPAEIKGQLEPFPMVRMVFSAYDQHTETLLIYQIVSEQKNLPIALPWIESILTETTVDINGNAGQLLEGERADGQRVNAVYWHSGGTHFIMVMTQPVRELLTLARSIKY